MNKALISNNEWDSPSDETGKTEALCHNRCGTIKIPSYSKVLSAEHISKFCCLSPAINQPTKRFELTFIKVNLTDYR
jgi:hypothetical protein